VGTGETVIQKAAEQFESAPLKTISLDKCIWMFAGDGGNVTIIVDEANTLLIDSRLDSRAAELTDATFKATWQPVTRLVNTHWHFDHTGGNAYFGSGGVTIIAQENVKNRGAERAFHWPARWASSNPGAINGDLFKQYDIEPGRSASDIGQLRSCAYGWDTIIYIAPANIAVVGDIFSNHFYPIIDLASGGSIDGMIQSLDQILAQTDEQTKIVPGHGPVATRSDL